MMSLLKRTASALIHGRLDRRTGSHDAPGPWIEYVRDHLIRGESEVASRMLVKALARFPRSRELMDLAVAVERRTACSMLPKVKTEARFRRDLLAHDAVAVMASIDGEERAAFSDFLTELSGERPDTPGFPAAMAQLERREVPIGCTEFPPWIESSIQSLSSQPDVTASVIAGSLGAFGWSSGAKLEGTDPRVMAAVRLACFAVPGTKGLGIGAHLESTIRGCDGEVVCVGTYGHVLTVATRQGHDCRRFLPQMRDVASALGRHLLKTSHVEDSTDG